jgi:GDP-L-fucose synthase
MSFYARRRVLVTGGTGTIGIALVRRLERAGADVTVAALDPPARPRALFGTGVRYRQLDLRDPDACRQAAAGQELVFNLVGIKGSVGIGVSRAASYFVPMLLFNTHMMEAAFRSGVSRYLVVSSICAYPPAALHVEDNLWNGLPRQSDRYAGVAKRVAEIQGETYLHEYGWDAVRIVRPSNVYGPFDDFEPATAQVIPALIRRMLDGEDPVRVWGDGGVVRDFIYVDDVAAGMLLALEKAPPCLPLNLGSGTPWTIREVAECIAAAMPRPPAIVWDPSKPSGDPVRLLSMARTREVIGFAAATPLAAGIAATIEWLRTHRTLAAERTSGLDHPHARPADAALAPEGR